MAFTQSDLDRLDAAIASGAKRVRFGSGADAQETEFRSLAEMNQVRERIVNAIAGGSAGPRITYAEHVRD